MKSLILSLVAVAAICVIGCKKSAHQPARGTGTGNGGGGGTTGGLPFGNGDYVGIFTELSRNYEKPIQIHFGADSSVKAYALFYMQLPNQNAFGPLDTIEGKVISVGTGDAGGPSATVYMTTTADTQVYNFTADLSHLQGGSNGLAGNQFYTSNLEKVPKPPDSLNGTFWGTDTARSYNNTLDAIGAYPDIDGVAFTTYFYAGVTGGSVTEYVQQGVLLNIGPEGIPPGAPIASGYVQLGSRVYFNGCGNISGRIINPPYFGVIMASGDSIFADSRSYEADLPILGNPGYGNTPVMHKTNFHY